jgi:hypothetical protein
MVQTKVCPKIEAALRKPAEIFPGVGGPESGPLDDREEFTIRALHGSRRGLKIGPQDLTDHEYPAGQPAELGSPLNRISEVFEQAI